MTRALAELSSMKTKDLSLSQAPTLPCFFPKSLHSQFWIPWVCAHFSIKVTLSGTVLSKGQSSSACSQFVSIVIDNLRSRFTEEGDASAIGALTKLFDPSLYSQSESDNSIRETPAADGSGKTVGLPE
jgi:hypothetical protein